MRRILLYIPWFRKSMVKVTARFTSAIRDLDALIEQNTQAIGTHFDAIVKMENKIDVKRKACVELRKESEQAERIAQRISELLK